MTNTEAIQELQEDKALYMPDEWIESLDRDTPDGRLITALDMAIQSLSTLNEIEKCIKFHNLEIKFEMGLLTGFEDFVIEQMKEFKE
mgnify:CR=1 FL=1